MDTSRTLSADVSFEVHTPATIAIQVSASTTAGRVLEERFHLWGEGRVRPGPPLDAGYGGLIHLLDVVPGLLTFSWFAVIEAAAETAAPTASNRDLEQLVMLRPSRYCPSDHVVGFAVSEFGLLSTAAEQAAAIASWIFERIGYVAGVSGVHDSAEHTLLTGQGVCRDFAHLGIVLCRALGIPARFVAVYAPGLDPMDFHAAFEAWHDGRWWAYDATRTAPRSTLVRIATGRDAADASFATVTSGIATLTGLVVTATSAGPLPADDHERGCPSPEVDRGREG